ncbi:flavonol 3-sulfotransferase-like [Cornus florida]|uniref:flavonol 3-sulfotransferase-like n=1 Tax=Cornus florida TaxID=4283 RepID=UPI00289B049F|nr:flavonol 3-sulfotransferase-like [Cornus florida]
MASSLTSQQFSMADTKKKGETLQKYTDLVLTLPRENGWVTKEVIKYQDTWLTSSILKGVMLVQQHFIALPTDILLATFPKCGTTWLKALIFAITNRNVFDFASHPLLTNGPHGCVPSLEALIQNNNVSTLSLSSARLLATHIPYHLLPASVPSSGCRIVYIFRNPKDVFVSSWYHMKKLRGKELPPLSLEEGVDMFCKGVYHFGPYWDHVLGYWNASLESPEKVLILTYEDMKKDIFTCVKRLAEFLGQTFSSEEERDGVVEDIVKLCSFDNLSNLEVNKTGVQQFTANIAIENNVFFRKGEVGDWQNHLTDEMVARLNQISEEKFGGTSLMSHIKS